MRKLRWTEVDRPSLLSTKFCGPNCCASTSRLLLVFTNNNSQSEPIARVLWSPCVSRAEANRNDSRCERSLLVWLSFPLDTRYTRLFGKAGYVLAVWCVRVCVWLSTLHNRSQCCQHESVRTGGCSRSRRRFWLPNTRERLPSFCWFGPISFSPPCSEAKNSRAPSCGAHKTNGWTETESFVTNHELVDGESRCLPL